jgi:glyoxylase-like metal-dependent hydrolase (beta-lactamase superfamily II)
MRRLQVFARSHAPAPGLRLLWTPGPSPGACVLHVEGPGLDALFCGRLLVPVAPGALAPLRTARTFHWSRQLDSLRRLLDWLPPQAPAWIATGAALGALRGQALVTEADQMLRSLALQ